ncbi:MAG: hypothetical protein M1834_006604 [Cirrosporium novae-zelandiae]|nr:MAG: hypothetical protein M1834_006604 [Cirrosporium novae-zelandiae]
MQSTKSNRPQSVGANPRSDASNTLSIVVSPSAASSKHAASSKDASLTAPHQAHRSLSESIPPNIKPVILPTFRQLKPTVFIIGLSGPSSSLVVPLSHLLSFVLPIRFLLHEDAFLLPTPPSATFNLHLQPSYRTSLDIPALAHNLHYLHAHAVLPTGVVSVHTTPEQLAAAKKLIPNDFLDSFKKTLLEHVAPFQLLEPDIILALVEGPLLYPIRKLREEIDIKIFLRAPTTSTITSPPKPKGASPVGGFEDDISRSLDFAHEHAIFFASSHTSTSSSITPISIPILTTMNQPACSAANLLVQTNPDASMDQTLEWTMLEILKALKAAKERISQRQEIVELAGEREDDLISTRMTLSRHVDIMSDESGRRGRHHHHKDSNKILSVLGEYNESESPTRSRKNGLEKRITKNLTTPTTMTTKTKTTAQGLGWWDAIFKPQEASSEEQEKEKEKEPPKHKHKIKQKKEEEIEKQEKYYNIPGSYIPSDGGDNNTNIPKPHQQHPTTFISPEENSSPSPSYRDVYFHAYNHDHNYDFIPPSTVSTTVPTSTVATATYKNTPDHHHRHRRHYHNHHNPKIYDNREQQQRQRYEPCECEEGVFGKLRRWLWEVV